MFEASSMFEDCWTISIFGSQTGSKLPQMNILFDKIQHKLG